MAYSGTYRGIRFRSLLELSAVRWLEREGFELGSTMLYEATRVPYGRGLKRTYVVDITLPQTRRLIEVKPLSRTRGRRNVSKRNGAELWALENGWSYSFLTDRDLSDWGALLTLREAAGIPEVRLDGRALKALGRKRRRRK
jgi:hypothetical protein